MRRYEILRRGVLALLLTAGLCGCIKDATSPHEDETVNMVLSLDTYAATADANATENEAAIKSAYVYIFNAAGVLENPGKVAVTPYPSGEATDDEGKLNATWSVTQGQKDIYVLLNAGHVLLDGSSVDLSTYNPASKSELETLLTNNPANFDDDFPMSGTSGMLMSGKTPAPVSVTTTSSLVTVPVERRYARIDLRLRRKAELAGSTIVVGNTTLKNRREKARAFAPATEVTGTDTSHPANHTAVTIGSSTTDYTDVISFYTLPRTAASKAACLDIAITIDGSAYTLPIYINSGATGGGTANNEDLPLDIEANCIYQVDATLGKQGVELQMNILEWNEVAVDGDIDGSSLVLESPVRVKANVQTLVPVQTKADALSVKLSSAAVTIGYKLTGAGSDGVLTVPVSGGKASIPITGPAAYPIGNQYTMTLVAGNIRRSVPLRVDGTPVLEVGEESLEFSYKGGTGSYTVASYIDLGNNTKVELPWKAEYSTDGGETWTSTRPSWLSAFTSSGNGSTTAQSYNAQIAAQTAVVNRDPNPSDEALRYANPVNSTYDLSTNGGKTAQNTANCYVINAAGTYRFPAVYGNARRGGANYPTAYTSTESGSTILTPFVNYLNQPISSPTISFSDAVLVWQDAPNLVQNVRYSGSNILFDVPQSTIKQGNAVIAVRDASGRIMWSWHIWVTDYKLDTTPKYVTNNQDVTYGVMEINLGWCLSHIIDYDPRSVLVRIVQPESGLNRTLSINQTAFQVRIGNQPYYQWGRKDPMMPAYYNAITGEWSEKTSYPSSSSYAYRVSTGKVPIGTAIQNPNVFYAVTATNFDWCNYSGTVSGKTNFYNLWNVNNKETTPNDNTTVKTIYDPCPVGYCMPPSNMFRGFTYDSEKNSVTTQMDGINSPYTTTNEHRENYGWVFYCNPMKGLGQYDTARGTVFIPLTGFLDGSTGSVAMNSFSGYYWLAIPSSLSSGATGTALGAEFSGTVRPYDSNNRSYGRAIRPIVGN